MNVLRKTIRRMQNLIIMYCRQGERKRKQNGLKMSRPSLITNDCIGGVISHDLGLKFYSPTVNLYMSIEDFLNYVMNLEKYKDASLEEVYEEAVDFPVGILTASCGCIKLYFMHYDSFGVAKKKWIERTQRIDYSNIYVILESPEGMSEKEIEQFESIPYENKVLITNARMKQSKHMLKMSFYESNNYHGKAFDYRSKFSGKRYIDEFDYVEFINTGKIQLK